ncbi:peptidoglycan-associated lipoprotein Pal [Desulfobulbus sp. F4]|nr:peptidoglycan-associated lipoprotein Pal [Desulfobulbus sp. F4]
MSIFMTRAMLCACMVFALAGCGSKPVEPYNQQKTAKADSSTFYDADSGAAADANNGADTAALGGDTASSLDNLPSSSGTVADIQNSPSAAPVVEPLTDNGGKASGFSGDNQSADYKRKNGRSSPQMKSIYYDYDQSTVRKDQAPKMEANAQYLKQHPNAKMIVEGNCDERGTKEYNLALGERRASSAKKYLINLGVETEKIRTMSFGEERPLFPGAEESDYEINRRSDFVLE